MTALVQGFLKKPQSIQTVGFFFILLPLLMILQQGFSSGFSLTTLSEYIVSDSFLHDSFCSVIAVGALLAFNRLGWLVFVSIGLYFIFVKFAYFHWNPNHLIHPLDIAVIFYWFSAIALVTVTHFRLPYLRPEVRWWVRGHRIPHTVPGAVLYKGMKFPVISMDFSKGGVFVKLDERLFQPNSTSGDRRASQKLHSRLLTPDELIVASKHADAYPTRKNETIRVQLATFPSMDNPFENNIFEAEATIVWTTKETDPMHYGLGLRFKNMPFPMKHNIKKYLKLVTKVNKRR
jgi:hypothetical protein